jgi:hypothetical protein
LLRSCREGKREVMGSIVSFVPRPAARTRRSEDHSVAASVIIFPGVRYERSSDQASEGSAVLDVRRDPRNPGPVHH